MAKPQQPELHRSGHTDVDPAHAKETTGGGIVAEPGAAPVPVANQPGHHPDVEQDKPKVRAKARVTATSASRERSGTRSAPKSQVDAPKVVPEPQQAPARPPEPTRAPEPAAGRFGFAFDPLHLPAAAAFGITPFTATVDVADGTLSVRFGLWRLSTPLDNVAAAEVTGPYNWFKVIGPPRLSLADRGLTFATNAKKGVCIRFREPVKALLPTGRLRHPAVTVTVADPAGLVSLLARAHSSSTAA